MNENAKKWVEALRSGEYKQGEEALRNGDRFCCLGVACDLFRKNTTKGEWVNEEFLGQSTVLPTLVRDWLGLGSTTGNYDGSVEKGDYADCLMGRNDNGASFAEIADTIEAEPKGLFR